MSGPQLHWQKASYKRWYAHVGPLAIEVERFGVGDDRRWRVGEMFGNHHTGHFEAHSLVDAQLEAERRAPELLRAALAAAKKAGPAT